MSGNNLTEEFISNTFVDSNPEKIATTLIVSNSETWRRSELHMSGHIPNPMVLLTTYVVSNPE